MQANGGFLVGAVFYEPKLVECHRFDCQYFVKPGFPVGKFHITIKTTFEAPSLFLIFNA